MKYYTEHTGYAGALDCLRKIGGQLFPGKGRDSSSTVVKGSQVYTFWQPNSLTYAKCHQAAIDCGFPHEHFTSGRISKHILETVCGIEPKFGSPDPIFVKLAKDGFHWHYTYVETGYHPYLLEFDLCSAYATSLAQFDSVYFSMNHPKINDGGRMENLRVALQGVPKWLRMVMIGQMATHRMTFATMPNRLQGDVSLKWQTITSIKYGYAFNRVHQSILRVYRLLEQIHRTGGVHVKRCHTDSFSLSSDTPIEIETEIFNTLDAKGFTYSCKAQGSSHFFDLNSGIVGRKFIGVPFEIRECLRALPEKPRRLHLNREQLERWGIRGVLDDRPHDPVVSPVQESHQLPIEGLNVARTPENPSRFA